MRIGLFGGSFDPVHTGHMKLAHEAVRQLGLDRVYFIPSRQNPLKSSATLLPARVRERLLREAVRGVRGFHVSDCELKRPGPSYTADTLKFFKRKFGPAAVLYFLTGADAARTLPRWKHADRILKQCRFIAFNRPGSKAAKTPRGVIPMPLDAVDISGTELRARIRAGKSVARWIPQGGKSSKSRN